jgi:hypothetical protein
MNCWRGIRNGEMILKIDTMIYNVEQIDMMKLMANFQTKMMKDRITKKNTPLQDFRIISSEPEIIHATLKIPFMHSLFDLVVKHIYSKKIDENKWVDKYESIEHLDAP